MKICKYNIVLHRLTEEDIELVRNWRNAKHVSQYMEYREYITPEMQKKWFKSINNINNFYYIIIYKGKKIGLVNDKNIFEKQDVLCAESGIFIADEKYRHTHIPLLVSLMLLEIGFDILGGKESYIHVLKSNHKAIKYNQALGFKLCENQENKENQKYYLTREMYFSATKKLRKAAEKFKSKTYPDGYILHESRDFELGSIEDFEKLFSTDLKKQIKQKKTEEGIIYYR